MANVNDVVAKVDELIIKETTAKATTQELLLTSSPLTQCEDLLIPAPLAITLAAKLILISNNNDFKLTKKEGGYTFLHWTSFRAAFAEVAHQLQAAFRLADKNTLEIAIKASDIPKEFNTAVTIIKKAPANEVSELLKIPLEQIRLANDACLQRTKEVKDQFILCTHMTGELLEATLDKEKETQTSLKEIEKRRHGILEAEKLAKLRKEQNEEHLKELKKKVEDADALVQSTFNDSDKFIFKATIIENITQVIQTGLPLAITPFILNPMAAVAAMAPQIVGAATKMGDSVPSKSENIDDTSGQVEVITTVDEDDPKHNAKICAYSKADKILELAENLFHFIDDGNTIGDDVLNAQDDQGYQEVYHEMKCSLNQPSQVSKNARHALDLCAKGWSICDKIKNIRQNPGSLKKSEVVDEIQKLYKDCKTFSNKALRFLGGNSGLNKIASKHNRSKSIGRESVYVNHTHFKLERSLEYLKIKQEEFDKAQEDRKQILEDIALKAEEIYNLSVDEVDYKNVRECLVQGMEVLGNLRTQWEYLVQYFETLSALIEWAVNSSKKFHQYAGSISKSDLLREIVYEEAFEAVKRAVIVQKLSKTYSEISQLYLMPQIGAIDQFFNARDRNDQKMADDRLRRYQLDAEVGIQRIIATNRTELSDAISARRMQLQAIKDLLEPIMSETDIKENKECVTGSLTYKDDDDEDIANAQL